MGNEQLQLLIESIPVLVVVTTPSGEVETVNRPTREYFGKTLEELKGWKTSDIVHPDDLQHTIAVHQKGLETGCAYNIESRLRRADRVYRWFNVLVLPVLDTNGRILHWLHLIIDIDDRKHAEEALRASESNLRQIIDSIPGLVATTSPTGELELMNRPFQEYFGKTAEEMRAWKTADVIHPDDLPRVIAGVSNTFTTGTPFVDEIRFLRADGAFRWFHDRIVPMRDAGGTVIRWYSLITDIDDRKRAEEALRRSEAYLAEAQQVSCTGSFGWDITSGEIYWSRETFRIFELEPTGKVTIDLILQRTHPEDRIAVQQLIERVTQQRTGFDFEHRLLMPGGSVKYIHVVGRPSEKEAGRFEFVGAVTDVSERKRAEEDRERLRQAQAELAHMNRLSMMGELATALAHEIKQPVAAAVLNANTSLRWLSHDEPDLEEAREAIRRTIKDGTRAAEIINRLRSFYTKGGSPQPELLDLNEVASEMLMLLRDESIRYRVTMRAELAPDLPSVMLDRVQLQQVFMNLMLNAIEAMKETGGELIIKSQLFDNGQLLISVSDNGVGLPVEKQEQIFDAFFTTKKSGTGMGLPISKSIIESHGGRLWTSRASEKGAIFQFTLPAATKAKAATPG